MSRPCEADTVPACENLLPPDAAPQRRHCDQCKARRHRVAVRECARKSRRAALHARIVADPVNLGLAAAAPKHGARPGPEHKAGPRKMRSAIVPTVAVAGLNPGSYRTLDPDDWEVVDEHGVAHDLDLAREPSHRQLDAEADYWLKSLPLLRRLLKIAERDREARETQSRKRLALDESAVTPYEAPKVSEAGISWSRAGERSRREFEDWLNDEVPDRRPAMAAQGGGIRPVRDRSRRPGALSLLTAEVVSLELSRKTQETSCPTCGDPARVRVRPPAPDLWSCESCSSGRPFRLMELASCESERRAA